MSGGATRTLVTGGCGAIGSQVCRRLIERGHEVLVLDDLSSGHRDNLPEGVELVVGDVSDAALLDRIFEGPGFDYVYHFAALFANQNSVEHPERDLEANGLGTLSLARRAARLPILKRFLYASSSCVYGRSDDAITEETTFELGTPYAITKLLGEHYLEFFRQQSGLPVTVIRLFNNYGPGERPGRYRNVIPNFVWNALHGEPLTITGTGEETRDLTFVSDTVSGALLAAESGDAEGRVYNIATGRETRILDLAREILRACDSSSEIRIVERRSWDRTVRRVADITRARTELGYEPRISLKEGIVRTVAWLRRLRG